MEPLWAVVCGGVEVLPELDWSGVVLCGVVPVVELVLLCELAAPVESGVELVLVLPFSPEVALEDGVVALGVAAEEPLWSVAAVPLFIDPVALLFGLVPVELVVPTWFWSLGVVVVVVVV